MAWLKRRNLLFATSTASVLAWLRESTASAAHAQADTSAAPQAFLVGNTKYLPSSQNIMTAHKNVRDIEDALNDLGYQTVSIFNANKDQILRGIDDLMTKTSVTQPALLYFCGHGINSLSQGEYRNYWVSSGLNLEIAGANASDPSAKRQHYEGIAQRSTSLEEEVFPRLGRRAKSNTFIVIDACRDAASNILDADNRVVQSKPPEGCVVSYATRPGRYAYTPRDFNANSYFAESFIRQLKSVADEGDMTQLLQRVRFEVRELVNSIAKTEGVLTKMLQDLGVKEGAVDGYLQEPDFAANTPNRATLRPGYKRPAAPVIATKPQVMQTPPEESAAPTTPQANITQPEIKPLPPVQDGDDAAQWAHIEALEDSDLVQDAIQKFLQQYPRSNFRANAVILLEDINKVRSAVRKTRLMRTPVQLGTDSVLQNTYKQALKGDKFAAQRIADAILKSPAMGDAAVALRWLSFAGELGNGLAAYEAFKRFNNQNLIQEASYYLALAESNGYRPPRDFDTRK